MRAGERGSRRPAEGGPYNPSRPPARPRCPIRKVFVMSPRLSRIASAAALVAGHLAFATLPANAADKVKIGFVSTLSGPSSALGVDIRDGFLLAIKLAGGKLGGLPAEVLVSDDQFKPDVAKQLFEKNIKRDKVDFMTGVVFSNLMLAAR